MAQIIADYATIATAIVATVALFIAALQIRSAKESQREVTAKELYKEYLKLALDHPEYSSPDYLLLSKLPENLRRYEWFVSYMLYACEEILDVFPGDLGWINTIEAQLWYHRDYLKFFGDTEKMTYYSDVLQKLINNVISGKTS